MLLHEAAHSGVITKDKKPVILRYFRRVLMTVGLLTLLIGASSLFIALKQPKILDHTILEIALDGPMDEAAEGRVSQLLGGGGASVSLITLTERIRAAATDARVDGILLHIKAPEI